MSNVVQVTAYLAAAVESLCNKIIDGLLTIRG